ncbi:PilZ domain-containing protein [Syntrophobacter fumaroxidans]|uniref:Type IV pilus assembly PilZ n=1 Tax=Syntrophobacter fumaroxidans (strain DSM 10017 / MPOB) TaxID=335543 RepID=A0LNQ4_SYNFM|nr:PilZ domain-containing protein [Syntrophobacter fumaroxidans]ABK19056.1 type IV pilus assembly PilZ [Syntrophobacter fumaroxidans MPOB]HOI95194.1 PilZ domain-containing protein [Syntrophobacter fumaroxidans]
MWPFRDRRKHKRYPVKLDAFLRCKSPESDDSVPVKILDLSLGGARIALERLQIGTQHLFIREDAVDYELTLPAGDAPLTLPVLFTWYNLDPECRVFWVGVSFSEIAGESGNRLKSVIRNFKKGIEPIALSQQS